MDTNGRPCRCDWHGRATGDGAERFPARVPSTGGGVRAKRRTAASRTTHQLPSGRWLARFRGEDGVMRPAPVTFATELDAVATRAHRLGGRTPTACCARSHDGRVAAEPRTSDESIRRAIAAGRLAALEDGRIVHIRCSWLEQYVERQRTRGAPARPRRPAR